MKLLQSREVKKAVILSIVCTAAYMITYLGRNVLSAVSPQLIEEGVFDTVFVGTLSSAFFVTYAVGQLVNGIIGEKLRADFMIGFGLIVAGVCLGAFVFAAGNLYLVCGVYGLIGFALSMIFAPMVKVTAENLKAEHASRCLVSLEMGALLGAPLAGLIAALVSWKWSFIAGGVVLAAMGVCILVVFGALRKKGILQYTSPVRPKGGGKIGLLIKNGIIRFSFVAILTGVVRTAVVFWIPTYLSQYLQFSAEMAASIFTVVTLLASFSSVLSQGIYGLVGRRIHGALLVSFGISAVAFGGMFLIQAPWVNIVCLAVAILFAQCASAMIWTRYCPGLSHTGMVSTATGYLDFLSYLAAAVSTVVFANAAEAIGWGNLILIWAGLMLLGVAVSDRIRK